jgi:hypothetical protein
LTLASDGSERFARYGKNLRGTAGMDAEEAEETITRARSCVTFTRWLVRTLLVGSILVAP